MIGRRAVLLGSVVLALMGSGISAVAQTPPIDGAVEALKPGEFLWAPDIAPEGPVTMIVGLKTQRAYLYRNGLPIAVSTISSGRPGYRTPTGIFTILQKDATHKSNLYKDAPMPFMQRLTWGGIALHAGDLPGYPDSHGCVRLPLEFAKLLFGVTRLGLTVVITDDAEAPEISPAPGIIASQPDDTHQPAEQYSWRPDRSLAGPISIVVSGRDRRLVVLRNGKEIGFAAITIDGPVETTEAFTLKSIDPKGIHWLRLPLPGNPKPIAPELTPIERGRAHLPEAFRVLLDGLLSPGTTLLITRDSLRSSGTGTNIVVLTADGKRTAAPNPGVKVRFAASRRTATATEIGRATRHLR